MLLEGFAQEAVRRSRGRSLFLDLLGRALSRKRHGGGSVAVVLVALDNFGDVNDLLGYEAGDRLLLEGARRISSGARAGDIVARVSDGEFAVLVEEPADRARDLVAIKVLEALEVPFVLGGREVPVVATVGIAEDSARQGAEELLHDARIAMSAAKSNGHCGFYEPGTRATLLGRLRLQEELRRAIKEREFVVHYQPIVKLGSTMELDEVCGIEALVRWDHPENGLLFPEEFIPLAEETGLISDIGLVVLEEACGHARGWRDTSPEARRLTLNVNISTHQFRGPDLAGQVSGILRESGLPADALKLEIIESTAMEDIGAGVLALHRLKDLGIGLAIDDFGTGHSSLSVLARLPVDELKVDRSFMDGLEDNPRATVIVSTTVALARALGLAVTAEGVESAGQLEMLRTLGFDRAQGFHLSRPLSADEVPGFQLPTLR